MNISDNIASNQHQAPASQFAPAAPAHNLQLLAVQFKGRLVFETSFSLEDQIITHLIAANKLPVRIFTRANHSKQIILKETVEKLGIAIEVIHQQSIASTRELAARHPAFAAQWEENPATAPISYLLDNQHLLLTGLRGQRNGLAALDQHTPLETSADGLKTRFHPLYHWSTEQLYDYARRHHIPVNLLPYHDFARIYAPKPPQANKNQVHGALRLQPVQLS